MDELEQMLLEMLEAQFKSGAVKNLPKEEKLKIIKELTDAIDEASESEFKDRLTKLVEDLKED